MISCIQITVMTSLAALVVAAPAIQERVVTEIYSDTRPSALSYDFGYSLSDGTSRFEKGELQKNKSDKPVLRIQGSYSWTAPDEGIYIVTYTADENGFKPIVEGPFTSGIADRLPSSLVASLLG